MRVHFRPDEAVDQFLLDGLVPVLGDEVVIHRAIRGHVTACFHTGGLIELRQLARKPGDHGDAAQDAISALLQVKLKAIFGFALMMNSGQTLP